MIDNDRFWDFQTSPIPGQTPAAPDPIGVGAAIQVLGSGNLFRDMSGSAGLASFLTSLVQGTSNSVPALIGQILGGGKSGDGQTPTPTTGGGQPATPTTPAIPPAPMPSPEPQRQAGQRTQKQPRASKPARPEPGPRPGKVFVSVAVDMRGKIDLQEVSAMLRRAAPRSARAETSA